jgi:hypothetical protein
MTPEDAKNGSFLFEVKAADKSRLESALVARGLVSGYRGWFESKLAVDGAYQKNLFKEAPANGPSGFHSRTAMASAGVELDLDGPLHLSQHATKTNVSTSQLSESQLSPYLP